MTNMKKSHYSDQLKKQYHNIEIPIELDQAIERGLSQARFNKRKRRGFTYLTRAAIVVLITISSLTLAINTSPAFASSFETLPLIGNLVKVLDFSKGSASGGQVTDGSDIEAISILDNTETESFIIHFTTGDSSQDLANAYTLHSYDYPNMIQFDIGGARMMSAQSDFETIQTLDGVEDIYTLMTLDDSLMRFNILFDPSVDILIEELSQPAGLRVTLMPKEDGHALDALSEELIYSVRSYSMPKSESFAIIEESLYWLAKDGIIEDYQIIKDSQGNFFYQLDTFNKVENAEITMNALKEHIYFEIFVEEISMTTYYDKNQEQ